jgi:hypothetical protein
MSSGANFTDGKIVEAAEVQDSPPEPVPDLR